MVAVQVGTRRLGAGEPCFIIAEAGVNHNGDPAQARALVQAAADAGADAVKFQTFTAELLATRDAPKAGYQAAAGGAGESQFDMLKRLELPRAAYPQLMADCAQLGIQFLSSPFDEASADFLDGLGVSAFKLPSGEITNLPLLEHVARKRKPMLVSTGMSDLAGVRRAIDAIAGAGAPPLVLLHCVSNYPAAAADANLRAIATLRDTFGVPCGYSDHVTGNEVALAAVALGACVIEKHLTLDRALPGPDQKSSAQPEEMRALVQGVRRIESALGDGVKRPAAAERATAEAARRSIVAARDIPAGAIVDQGSVALRRPGTGLPPAALAAVIGRKAKRDIPAGTLLAEQMLE